MVWKGFKDVQATIIIDLNKSVEELWTAVDKDARWGVKKAKKEKLMIKKSNKKQDLDEFYKIYKQTCDYGGITPKPMENIKDSIFFFCKKQDKIIAGAAIIDHENYVELFLNASLHESLKYQPNNLLYWAIILWAKKNNYSYFDLGGYQLNAQKATKLYEINRFKKRWGGEIVKSPVYSRNPIKIFGRKAIRNSKTLKFVWDRIKGRPIRKK